MVVKMSQPWRGSVTSRSSESWHHCRPGSGCFLYRHHPLRPTALDEDAFEALRALLVFVL